LDVDQEIADRWAISPAQEDATVSVTDGLLAVRTIRHNLTLVTRNAKDMARTRAALSIPGLTKAIVARIPK
jgi:predicted nucleic acid-binding protein